MSCPVFLAAIVELYEAEEHYGRCIVCPTDMRPIETCQRISANSNSRFHIVAKHTFR